MEDNKLEDWIKNNRDNLDFDELDDDAIWQGINQTMRNKKNKARLFLSWAAIIVPIIGLSLFYLSDSPPVVEDNVFAKNLSDIDPKWKSIEANYEADIKQQWAKIKTEEIDPNRLEFLLEELKVLDEVNLEYRAHLPITENEKLVNTLIDYYEKKTRILGKILKEIDRKKKTENKNRSYEI